MSTLIVILWVICGAAAHQLDDALSARHSDMGKAKNSEIWLMLIFGPFYLLSVVLIALGYALGWHEKKEGK